MLIAKNRLTNNYISVIIITIMQQFNNAQNRERISGRDSQLTDGRSQADTGATAQKPLPVFQQIILTSFYI